MLNYFHILFLFVFLSNLLADEIIYPYKFEIDSTITGLVITEGHIFPNGNLSLVSIYNTFKYENQPPSILFYDEDYNLIEKLELTSSKSSILRNILVFDFDGDCYDEIVFAITEPDKIWFLFYDPSNTPQIKTKIFEIPIKDNFDKVSCNMSPVQVEGDNFYELIVTINEQSVREFTKRGMWAISIQKRTSIWETYSAENLTKSNILNYAFNNEHYLIYSSSSGVTNKVKLFYSEGNYFYINTLLGDSSTYDKNFNINPTAILNPNSNGFSTDSVATVRAVNSKNELIWKNIVGGLHTVVNLNPILINNKEKILLSCISRQNSFLEIIDPITGAIEKRKELYGKYNISIYQNRIFASTNKNGIKEFDLDFNCIDSAQSKLKYYPFASVFFENEPLVLLKEGPGILQTLVALNSNLEKVASIEAQGAAYYLPKSKLISVYDAGKRVSRFFVIKSVEWYKQISVDTLRNLVISFLFVLTVIMVLWINTLRVSWKKIKKQKEELETAHNELKETTNKLVQAEKLAVYGTIASGIAHEINSPLGAIINSAQRIKGNKDINFNSNINLIEKAGKRAKSIIEKLLIGSHGNGIEAKTNFVEVLNEWKDLSIKQFENLGITLITEINGNPDLAISSTELNQILTNLLFNARDSIMDKGTEKKSVLIKTSVLESVYSIVVQDTGLGFSKSKLEKPFEAFVSTKEKGKGTGLGLWVIKNIIDNINGEIKVGNYEMGAVIEIKIPLYFEKMIK